MKQELFKEMYDNINLDRGQKDRILDCIKKESYQIKATAQKRIHIPASAAICACIAMLVAVPVLAATPVLDRIIQAFDLFYANEVELTEEQKNLYSKYGSVLDNEITLKNCTLKLEAVICDKNYICIPFSVTLADKSVVAGEDICNKSLYKDIQEEISSLIFCQTDTEYVADFTNMFTSMYTMLPSTIQDDGTLKGCYLLYYGEKTVKQGNTIYVRKSDKRNILKSDELVSKFKINKIVESQNIPVDKKLLKSQELHINNIEISPLSLRIDGISSLHGKKTKVISDLYFDDITVELKDGTVVKRSNTGSAGNEDSETHTYSQTILFEGPVNLDDVAGVRIKSNGFNLWFPYV